MIKKLLYLTITGWCISSFGLNNSNSIVNFNHIIKEVKKTHSKELLNKQSDTHESKIDQIIDKLSFKIKLDQYLGNSFVNFFLNNNIFNSPDELDNIKRRLFTIKALNSFYELSKDNIHTSDIFQNLIKRLHHDSSTKTTGLHQYQQRNYTLLQDLLLMHIMLNPLELLDGGYLSDQHSQEKLKKLVDEYFLHFEPIKSYEDINKIARINTDNLKIFLDNQKNNLSVDMFYNDLQKIAQFSKNTAELENDASIYSMNLMLVLVFSDLQFEYDITSQDTSANFLEILLTLYQTTEDWFESRI